MAPLGAAGGRLGVMPERPLLRIPVFKSTFARAVVPVAAGLAFIALMGLALWGVAAIISGDPDQSSNLIGPRTFQPGSVKRYAQIIDESGPVMFPDLLGTDGDNTIVLDHQGTDPMAGWKIYLAHPADKPLSCKVTQARDTALFVDYEGRTIGVTQLALPPDGVRPVISRDGILDLDVTPTPTAASTTISTP